MLWFIILSDFHANYLEMYWFEVLEIAKVLWTVLFWDSIGVSVRFIPDILCSFDMF